MDKSVGPNDFSTLAILLGESMNSSLKVRLHGQQRAIVIPLDFLPVFLTIL